MSTFCVVADGDDYPLGGDDFVWSSVRHGIAREVAVRLDIPVHCVEVEDVDWCVRRDYASVSVKIQAPIRWDDAE